MRTRTSRTSCAARTDGFNARQIYLQRCLGVPTPEYLHVPVVTNDQGEKLSKQNGATALDHAKPLEALSAAARHLGLEMSGDKHVTLEGFYAAATTAWAERMGVRVQPN
jgi:Glutamyl- and glutaminyl-tRNA synthetases